MPSRIIFLLFVFISTIISCSAQVLPQGFLKASIPFVVIGTQTWMKKNLDVTNFRNGELIPQVASNTATPNWASYGTNAAAAWVYNNYDVTNNEVYGKLYNWFAVSDARGICPIDWHVPSDAEWLVLVNYSGTDTSNGGKKLKETGTTHWASSSAAVASNTTGFTALGGGYMGTSGSSSGSLTLFGYFWSSTFSNASLASYHHLEDNRASFNVSDGSKKGGFSVRCIHD